MSSVAELEYRSTLIGMPGPRFPGLANHLHGRIPVLLLIVAALARESVTASPFALSAMPCLRGHCLGAAYPAPIHAAPAAGVPEPGTLRASCALGRFAAVSRQPARQFRLIGHWRQGSKDRRYPDSCAFPHPANRSLHFPHSGHTRPSSRQNARPWFGTFRCTSSWAMT